LNKAFVLKSGKNYPTKYFSIKWEGYVVAFYTETYRFSIEAFAASDFELLIEDQVIIKNILGATDNT